VGTLPQIHPELAPRTSSIGGVSVREDLLFTDAKGREKPALRKAGEAFLERLKNVLPRVLEPGETVPYITLAVAPLSVFEQLTLGWYAVQLKGVTLVLTDGAGGSARVADARAGAGQNGDDGGRCGRCGGDCAWPVLAGKLRVVAAHAETGAGVHPGELRARGRSRERPTVRKALTVATQYRTRGQELFAVARTLPYSLV